MSKNAAKFTLGALFGLVAGLVAGVLAAPKSGKATRAELKRKATEVKKAAESKTTELKGKALETSDEVLDEVEELKARTRSAVEGARAGFDKTSRK